MLDELLHLPGFSSSLIYGEDANLNGRLDANEDDGEAMAPPDNQDGKLDLGLRQFLTLCSYDLNWDTEGQLRLNLNQTNLDQAGLDLPQSAGAYLQAMSRNGQTLAHPADLLEASGKFKDEQGKEITLSSGVGKTELPVLLDRCTATNQTRLIGLVNLNTASAEVLAALPGMDEALAEAIVSARASLGDEARRTPAWLFQEGLVNAELFRKIAPFLTTRSFQFHFHVIAYAQPAGIYRILEATIDTAAQPPRILCLRDITRLGLPFGLAPKHNE
jgi:DNA uptake protein ComE-like DNA-binding protein